MCQQSRQVVASCNFSWDNGNPAVTNDLRRGPVLQLQFWRARVGITPLYSYLTTGLVDSDDHGAFGRRLGSKPFHGISGFGGIGEWKGGIHPPFEHTLRSISRSESSELTLQRVDLCKVAARVVIAASLAASESETPEGVSVSDALATEVDNRRQVLLLR
jgi:hypothetical protein